MPRYEESAKKLLELLVSLAADLFDFEIGPWPARFYGRIGDDAGIDSPVVIGSFAASPLI